MMKYEISIPTSQDALWVAEALSAQISVLQGAADSRSLFSAGFNRKLIRKIEILDSVREQMLVVSRGLLADEEERLRHG